MRRAAFAASIAAATLFLRHAATIINQARREQAALRKGRIMAHRANYRSHP